MATPLADIALLLLDVDGVLTDGCIELGEDGIERRRYHARDGIGLRLARDSGLAVGVVTSSPSEGIRTRAQRLGIEHICIGVRDKAAQLQELARELKIEVAQVAFMGDDLVDLPAMLIAGLAIAVADATAPVRDYADIVTTCPGGHGAVREICELLVGARAPDFLADKQQCGLLL